MRIILLILNLELIISITFYIIIRSPGRLSVEVKGYTVHSIQRLLNKLVNCGAGGLLLALTRDFLTLKEQYVGVG